MLGSERGAEGWLAQERVQFLAHQACPQCGCRQLGLAYVPCTGSHESRGHESRGGRVLNGSRLVLGQVDGPDPSGGRTNERERNDARSVKHGEVQQQRPKHGHHRADNLQGYAGMGRGCEAGRREKSVSLRGI